jgi:hypothetical protein
MLLAPSKSPLLFQEVRGREKEKITVHAVCRAERKKDETRIIMWFSCDTNTHTHTHTQDQRKLQAKFSKEMFYTRLPHMCQG